MKLKNNEKMMKNTETYEKNPRNEGFQIYEAMSQKKAMKHNEKLEKNNQK